MTQKEALWELEHGKYKDDVFVKASAIAPVLKKKPETLINKAKNPGDHPLPFKFVITGTGREQVDFVKQSFIDFAKGKKR